ncbi:MAG TPA: D-alanyl-lipoteichoic acid biosynthesis protein DltD [Candidatus Babeliales bacterium]|jgi:D-alanine transfer protein|nr:D-alanyl-lipoteichoic acid biosynthesis protein DltD [Candidatus Babeliales bacterium]
MAGNLVGSRNTGVKGHISELMVNPATARSSTLHLTGALIACAIVIGILCSGRMLAIQLERKTVHLIAPKDFFIKNQGLAFQRAAAHRPDILLLYGSSELLDPIPNRASDFFASAPTGFQVCPVGKAGATSLTILQKLAALGADLHGRKVAISLSASSFLRPAVRPDYYAGNFSLMAASNILFGNAISSDLKTAIAKRMLQFPDTLSEDSLVELAARCFASGRPSDRMILMAIWPLGKLKNAMLDLQDHFEALVYILARGRQAPDWLRPEHSHTLHVRKAKTPKHKSLDAISPARDAAFRLRIARAGEWNDLELLFRTLAELKADPLILSMPIDAYAATGVSRSAREVYYERMRELAGRYHVPVVEFEQHDADPGFLIARREHPTPRGWMVYDRALNDFFRVNK